MFCTGSEVFRLENFPDISTDWFIKKFCIAIVMLLCDMIVNWLVLVNWCKNIEKEDEVGGSFVLITWSSKSSHFLSLLMFSTISIHAIVSVITWLQFPWVNSNFISSTYWV